MLLRARSNLHVRSGRRALLCFIASLLIGSAAGDKLILELADETLDGPRAGFTEGADSTAPRNIVRDAHQVIGIVAPPTTVREPMQGLAHPERSFPAGSALTT